MVNTLRRAASLCFGHTWYLQLTGRKPDPSMMVNGMLAGLVAITAPLAFVDTWAACVIGAVAGVLVVWAVGFFDKFVDDPVGGSSGSTEPTVFGDSFPCRSICHWANTSRRRLERSDSPGDGRQIRLRRRTRPVLRRRASQLWAQLTQFSRVVLVFGFATAGVVQVQQLDHAAPRAAKSKSKASTCLKWVCWVTRALPWIRRPNDLSSMSWSRIMQTFSNGPCNTGFMGRARLPSDSI